MIRTKLTISALVFLALAGSTALANNKWSGSGGDILWNNPANWGKGIPDPAVDNRCQIDGPDIEVLIDATHVGDEEAMNEEIRVAYTAGGGAVTLTVDGGTLRCTNRLFLAAREETTGTIVVDNGGQVIAARITLGRIGDGVIILNDGLVDCSAGQVEFGLNVGSGTLILNGGSFKALGFLGSNNGRIELNGGALEVGSLTLGAVTMDITDGALIVEGDQTALVQADAQAGFITTFGHDGSRGGLVVSYDADLDQTLVTADAAGMDLHKAWKPSPLGGGVSGDSDLVWNPGDFTAVTGGHDVYLGTDLTAVTDSEIDNPLGVYQGRQDANSFDPGELALGRTYYWRVDQVNGQSHEIHRGDVWSFTVVGYMVVDGFEDYNDYTPDRIFQTWIDGFGYKEPPPGKDGNGTGSTVGYLTAPFTEQSTVHGGAQSMPFGYDNTALPFYSEAERDFLVAQDFSRRGVKSMTLWIYGDPCNVSATVYVGLQDSAGTRVDVTEIDTILVTTRSWQEINIELSQFSPVNLMSVKKIYLGVGNRLSPMPGPSGSLFIDDIRLYVPRCVPERTLPDDLNGDCTVDAEDLTILTERWLAGTIQVVAAEPSSEPAMWHKFEKLSSVFLELDDEMGLAPATASPGVTLDLQGGYDGSGAVVFAGTDSYLDVNSAVFEGMAGPELTVSLWIYGDPALQPFANDAVFHATGAGGFSTQLMCPDSLGRVVFDHGIAPVDRVVWSEADPADWEGQWNHYALVKNATEGIQRIYHNGRLVAENTDAFQSTPGTGTMRIGASDQPTPQRLYHGKLDEFRIYATALPQAAILHLANGTQIDQAPVTPADINGDGIVDQADFASLAQIWLGELLWP